MLYMIMLVLSSIGIKFWNVFVMLGISHVGPKQPSPSTSLNKGKEPIGQAPLSNPILGEPLRGLIWSVNLQGEGIL